MSFFVKKQGKSAVACTTTRDILRSAIPKQLRDFLGHSGCEVSVADNVFSPLTLMPNERPSKSIHYRDLCEISATGDVFSCGG